MNGGSKRRGRRGGGGFTLIEVVTALLIIGLLSVAVSAGLRTHASVVAEADVLRVHLRFVQSLATANNTAEWSVLFGGNSYTLQRDGAESPVSFPGEGGAVHRFPGGIALVGGAGTLVLNQWGAPEATHVVTLSDGQLQRSITITGYTGLIP